MGLPIAIRCPHCDATLKIKDPAALGRAGKCPRCGERFIAQAPAEPESATYDLEQEPSLPPLPTRRAEPKAAKDESSSNRKKKATSKPAAKLSSSNMPLRLIADRGVAAVMLLVSRAVVVRRSKPRWLAGSAAALLMLMVVVGVGFWKISGRRARLLLYRRNSRQPMRRGRQTLSGIGTG